MFCREEWRVLQQSDKDVQALSSALSVGELTARALINRGFTDPSSADAFLKKTDSFLHDPFLMKDIEKAVSRIQTALAKREKITIYGDYDADGVTAVTVLFSYLRENGADVDYYIPTRDGDGYGVNNAAFSSIRKGGTTLVITVDTGITAVAEIEYASSIGLDVIVTDHHICRPELPSCIAVVNPHRPDCDYPFTELSGVGVAFKLCCAMELTFVNDGEYNLFTVKEMCRRYIDLVTLGTVADVMPLQDENRIIAHMGLSMLGKSGNLGIRSLLRAIGIDTSIKMKASKISYSIAPRINAAGRIGDAARAVKLFLSTSPLLADSIAEELCVTNEERRNTENEILAEAITRVEQEHDLEKERILVVAGENWHQGIIGIVAARVTERFGRPSILITFDGAEDGDEGIGKGSGRSVAGINLVEALNDSGTLLAKHGGHELAAGLSIKRGMLSAFRERINAYVTHAAENLPEIPPSFSPDAEITERDVSEKTVNELSLLEPCGTANPDPIFLLAEAKIIEIAALSDGKHTRLILSKGERELKAICFHKNLLEEGFTAGDTVDLVCEITINEFRGNRTVQLSVKDIDHSSSFWTKIKEADQTIDAISEGGKVSVFTDDIPCRNDFARFYTVLKNDGFAKGKQIRIMKLLTKLSGVSYIKMKIMLKVFSECELCESRLARAGALYIKLLTPSEKKNLDAAPFMQKLLQKE